MMPSVYFNQDFFHLGTFAFLALLQRNVTSIRPVEMFKKKYYNYFNVKDKLKNKKYNKKHFFVNFQPSRLEHYEA